MNVCTTRSCGTCTCPHKFFGSLQSMVVGRVSLTRGTELQIGVNSPFGPQSLRRPQTVKKARREASPDRISKRFKKSLEILA